MESKRICASVTTLRYCCSIPMKTGSVLVIYCCITAEQISKNLCYKTTFLNFTVSVGQDLTHLDSLFQGQSQAVIKVGCSHQKAQLGKDPFLSWWLLDWFNSLWVVDEGPWFPARCWYLLKVESILLAGAALSSLPCGLSLAALFIRRSNN